MINWQPFILESQYTSLKTTELMVIPVGDTASRPSGASLEDGIIRINTDIADDPVIEWYHGTTWYQAGSGSGSGTVTSVDSTIDGTALSIAGVPITTSGSIDFTWTGTTSQYVRGDGSLETFPTLFTTEDAQDAVGTILVDTLTINFTYTDGTPEIKADLIVGGTDNTETNFMMWDGDSIELRTLASLNIPDTEIIQDAVGAMIVDTATINLTYTDATPELKADLIVGAIDNDIDEFLVWDGTNVKRREFDSLCREEIEIRFRVGDDEYPQNDENTFDASTLSTPIDITNKRIRVYREGERQFPNDAEYGIEYDETTGVIIFYPNLAEGEDILIEAEEITSCFTAYDPPLAPLVAGTIVDDGYYNGFPFPHQLEDGTILSLYKKSGSHADKGPLTLAKSRDGGASWTEAQIVISSVAIEAAALSLGVLPNTERILIAYQDDELYTSIKFAYSDNKGVTWTSAGTISAPSSGTFSPSPVKMLIMPSGTIRCVYYLYEVGSDSRVGFIDSTDDGESWAIADDINIGVTNAFGDYRLHETAVAIVDDTGVDSTCTLVAYCRGDNPYYVFLWSTDGGTTWNEDLVTVNNPGAWNRYFFYNLNTTPAPVDCIVHGTNLVIVCGVRAPGNYQLQYVTIPLVDAVDNNYHDFSAPTSLVNFNATTLGADIDCGYPVLFHDWEGKLWCHYYDVSTEPVDTGITTDRCWIKQIKIMD